ncbi:hypothetical protein [Gordonia soli]|uniref:hypothetical protein n=1 Tax=Gordonia soli TaxID=320799 RepID=UPI0003458AC6|nr:hypothetical protein [Gordonia soli]
MSIRSISPSGPGADKQSVRSSVESAIADDAVHRLVVRPLPDDQPDAYFALAVAALMVLDRLDVEVAYVSAEPTQATRALRLPHGDNAVRLAETGTATPTPLIRDDAATVLVGRARHVGAGGAPLHGETIVDDQRLFLGEAAGVEIEPTGELPGLRARLTADGPLDVLVGGLRPRRRWRTGRAAQSGGTNLVVEREGVLTDRIVKRSTFYRHHVDLLLVRPHRS